MARTGRYYKIDETVKPKPGADAATRTPADDARTEPARLFPPTACDLLRNAAATDYYLPYGQSKARIIAIDRTIAFLKGRYPHMFKELV